MKWLKPQHVLRTSVNQIEIFSFGRNFSVVNIYSVATYHVWFSSGLLVLCLQSSRSPRMDIDFPSETILASFLLDEPLGVWNIYQFSEYWLKTCSQSTIAVFYHMSLQALESFVMEMKKDKARICQKKLINEEVRTIILTDIVLMWKNKTSILRSLLCSPANKFCCAFSNTSFLNTLFIVSLITVTLDFDMLSSNTFLCYSFPCYSFD